MSYLVAWLLVSLMNSFGANFPRYAELAAGPRNVHPRWGNLGLGRVIAPANKTWQKLILWWFDFDAVYHSHYLTLHHSLERWSCFCGLSVRTTPRGVNKTNTRESVSGAQRELLQIQYWQGVMLTAQWVHDVLSPRFFQEVQRHPSAKTHKMEIWQIMMDYLQWYVNPVDAVLFLGKMEPDRIWPSGELKEIEKLECHDQISPNCHGMRSEGSPLAKLGVSTATESGLFLPKSKLTRLDPQFMDGWWWVHYCSTSVFWETLLVNTISIPWRYWNAFFGRNVMSFAYSPSLLSSPNPIWVSLPLRRPSIAREAARRPSIAREGTPKKQILWQRRGEMWWGW